MYQMQIVFMLNTNVGECLWKNNLYKYIWVMFYPPEMMMALDDMKRRSQKLF